MVLQPIPFISFTIILQIVTLKEWRPKYSILLMGNKIITNDSTGVAKIIQSFAEPIFATKPTSIALYILQNKQKWHIFLQSSYKQAYTWENQNWTTKGQGGENLYLQLVDRHHLPELLGVGGQLVDGAGATWAHVLKDDMARHVAEVLVNPVPQPTVWGPSSVRADRGGTARV